MTCVKKIDGSKLETEDQGAVICSGIEALRSRALVPYTEELDSLASAWLRELCAPSMAERRWAQRFVASGLLSVSLMAAGMVSPFVNQSLRYFLLVPSLLPIPWFLYSKYMWTKAFRSRRPANVVDSASTICEYCFKVPRQRMLPLALTLLFSNYLFPDQLGIGCELPFQTDIDDTFEQIVDSFQSDDTIEPEAIALCNQIIEGTSKWSRIPRRHNRRFVALGMLIRKCAGDITLSLFSVTIERRMRY